VDDVERCLAGFSAPDSAAPGDTAPEVSGPPETESLFGVFGPPILESRFLSYAWDEVLSDLCSSCRSLCNLWDGLSVLAIGQQRCVILSQRAEAFSGSGCKRAKPKNASTINNVIAI
jgi:hypothetical protein